MTNRHHLSGRQDISSAAQAACLLEVAAAKPGNVSRYTDFRDLFLEDFLLSALAIGQHLEQAARKTLGETILAAVTTTGELVGTNTNLGIILLFAPIAKAWGEGNLRSRLREVLASSTVQDNVCVYRAVELAGAGGMGKVPEADLSTIPEISLYESMRLAKGRDSIAREYVTDYAITFELALPLLESLLDEGCDLPKATVELYLKILAQVPDTLIARKAGMKKAREISRGAADIIAKGSTATKVGKDMIGGLDRHLRSRGNTLNPGTTADLTATALFVYFLKYGLPKWKDHRPTGRKF